jgi:His-Xaa-Ser system radical SAM maturase HxsB
VPITFHVREHFSPPTDDYNLLPFRFLDFDGRKFLVNEVGEHLFLEQATFEAFVSHRLERSTPEYSDLKSKHFLFDSGAALPVSLLATKYRTKRSFLAGFTGLHIFVVSLRCDHSCHYCQVSRVSINKQKYDMSEETARRAIDLVFRSPANPLKIEFQGGEPLLNFELVQLIVTETERRAAIDGRSVEFVIATNLAFLSDEVLAFCRTHEVLISTSLDGPAFLHNANRPRPGNDSYEVATRSIDRVRQELGFDRVSALMTTSRLSLEHPVEIVDEYVARGFDHIFLRPISPYGFALRTRTKTGYELDQFLSFYKEALAHIIELNRSGTFLVEDYAKILLTKILTPFPTGYVDLQSPAGVGIGVAVYNYDGDVYVSDEARMLAEMGDRSFRLGNVHQDSYEELFLGEKLKSLISDTVIESLPVCADCAFQSYCGADPMENYATQGSVIGHRPLSFFHKRNFEIICHLIRLYYSDDPFVKPLFWSWINNRPVRDLLPAIS